MQDTVIKHGICGLCGGKCMMDVYFRNGEAVKVEGNRSLPYSNGYLCVKGAAIRQYVYHPDRLLYPMKRTGKRGEGKFERISWEEALDTVALQMRRSKEKYGARETMIYVGHPKWFRPQLSEFAAKYGTPNYGSESSTCAYSLMMAAKCCFGRTVNMPVPDTAHCRTLLLWGVNPMYSDAPNGGVRYEKMAQRGVDIIAVDPRCTPSTDRAALHLRPIPGTDGALALGMARVMIEEDLYDHEFVEKYTYGFEEYRQYVMRFTPERTEEITGVFASDIIKAARMFALNKPAAIQMSASPVVHNINGLQNARAVLLLSALNGCYGVEGGNMPPGQSRALLNDTFLSRWKERTNPEEDLSHKQFPAWAQLLYSEVQLSRMADYLRGEGDYPIRQLIAFGMNHRMWPRPDHLEKAFDHLRFFVNVDSFMTETSKYADILLPAALSFEREQIEILGPDIVYYQPVVGGPEGEVRPDVEIIVELSKRLGFTVGSPPITSYEDYLRSLLTTTGISLEELKKHPEGLKSRQKLKNRSSEEMRKFYTPSGKIEFHSIVLENCGRSDHEPLPVYHEYRKKLPLEAYPLILSTGSRRPQLFHSRTYRIPWLRNLEKAVVVAIHPQDARKIGIENGELVTMKTPEGQLELETQIDSSCLPGVVNVYHGAGDKDINLLLDENYLDPISGFPGFKSYCCRIEKRKKGNE